MEVLIEDRDWYLSRIFFITRLEKNRAPGIRVVNGPLYQPRMIHERDEAFDEMRIGRGNQNTQSKTCISAALTTTDPKSNDLGPKSSRRGDKPATNPLSYGMTLSHSNKTNSLVLWPHCL
jgi:hypothetical protein